MTDTLIQRWTLCSRFSSLYWLLWGHSGAFHTQLPSRVDLFIFFPSPESLNDPPPSTLPRLSNINVEDDMKGTRQHDRMWPVSTVAISTQQQGRSLFSDTTCYIIYLQNHMIDNHRDNWFVQLLLFDIVHILSWRYGIYWFVKTLCVLCKCNMTIPRHLLFTIPAIRMGVFGTSCLMSYCGQWYRIVYFMYT